eukprot:gene11892-biopygen3388
MDKTERWPFGGQKTGSGARWHPIGVGYGSQVAPPGSRKIVILVDFCAWWTPQDPRVSRCCPPPPRPWPQPRRRLPQRPQPRPLPPRPRACAATAGRQWLRKSIEHSA